MPRLLEIGNKHNLDQKNIRILMDKYKCPIWIYDSSIINFKINQLKKFDIIRFAQKSCSNINILRFMRKKNVKIDAVSLGEIKRALYSGFEPSNNDIIFTSDIFETETLLNIIQLKIPVNIGSINMIEQIGKSSINHPIWLRINPGFGSGHDKKTNTGGKNSKHGIWYKDLKNAFNLIKKYKLCLIGLHIHIGSGARYSNLKKVCNSMLINALSLNANIFSISAGGGLPIPYRNTEVPIDINHYYDLWNNTRKKLENHFRHKIQLEIEPGRYLVAESGILVSQICAIKDIEDHRFVLINAGFNDLIRPVLYGSYHHISIISFDNRQIKNKKKKTIVAGPLCESGDIFTQFKNGNIKPRMLPLDIRIGDYVIFHDTGAYGASMSSNYNTRPLIPEIFFENGNIKEIRRKQTIEEILALEKENLIF